MTGPDISGSQAARSSMGFREFVALIAMLQTTSALGVDLMLPALPAISSSLRLVGENQRQLVIGAYLLGLGAAMILYGPLADRFGRRRIILTGLISFVAMSGVAAAAGSFELLVAARFLQGCAAAAMRTLTTAIVRARDSGRDMARVLSLSMTIVLLVPILAPALGQLIMLLLPWRSLFWALALFSGAVSIWLALRLPETLPPEQRQSLEFGRIGRALMQIVTTRQSLGYALCGSIIYGSLLGFIFSAQQIFEIGFGSPDLLAPSYAVIGGVMAAGALSNARLVGRYGTRMLSHGALLCLATIAALHSCVALAGAETVWTLILFQSLQMFCFGLSWSNFNAMAMEPMGAIAGTASSTQSAISTVVGVGVGSIIGQNFNGTTVPVALGFLVVAIVAIAIVAVTERGRLFARSVDVA